MAAAAGPHRLDGLFDDGTLGITTTFELVVFDRLGIERRMPIPAGTEIHFGPEAIGVLNGQGTSTILDVPSLKEQWAGPGSFVDFDTALPAAPQPQVLFWRGGRLHRLVLPVRALPADVNVGITFAKEARTAVVHWRGVRTVGLGGLAVFDVATEKLLRSAPVLVTPEIVAETLYGVDGMDLVALDVAGHSPARRKKIPCSAAPGADSILWDANESHLIVMCRGNGTGVRTLLFDARTLSFRRDIGTVQLNCQDSDGALLPESGFPSIDKWNPDELVTRACTSELRFDLKAAKYRCCDDPELVRANGFAAVPRCTSPGAMPDSRLSASYTLSSPTEGPWRVHSKGVVVEVEHDARYVAVSHDESRLVYQLPDVVVLRSLPDGEIVRRYAVTKGAAP